MAASASRLCFLPRDVARSRWRAVPRGRGWSPLSTAAAGAPGGELNPETVSYLVDRGSAREVYLVGTAHVSEASAEDVRQAIRIAKPHGVMVELCESRAQRLRAGGAEGGAQSGREMARGLLKQALGKGGAPGFTVELLLKLGLQGFYALLRQCGLVPGLEFRVALEEAEKLKLPICLGDRPVDETISRLRVALGQISLARAHAAPPLPPGLGLTSGGAGLLGFSLDVEGLKNRRQIGLLRDYVGDWLPELMDAMVRQRDALMTEKLLTECQLGRTVAVVGMAHMDGIEEEWRKRGGDVFLHSDNSLRSAGR